MEASGWWPPVLALTSADPDSSMPVTTPTFLSRKELIVPAPTLNATLNENGAKAGPFRSRIVPRLIVESSLVPLMAAERE